MSSFTSRFAKLNPFSGEKPSVDHDDIGEAVDATSMAGGGHAGRETQITQQLNVSAALRSFLVRENVISHHEAGSDESGALTPALKNLLDKPHVRVPPELTDRSRPLPEYFISSSHNTYLQAHQLYGSSSVDAYRAHLKAGARCVEIDAWDDDGNVKVTHGWTLTSSLSFWSVCETIRDVVDEEAQEHKEQQGYRAAPILLSLENHCGPEGQKMMVDIMKEMFGHRLLSQPIREKGSREQEGTGEHVTLSELGAKIAVIVEYHFAGDTEDHLQEEDSSDSGNEDEETKKARKEYQEKKRQAPATIIIPELAELGVYAQSVKPPNNAWFEVGVLQNSPHHPLINVSESQLLSHMPKHNDLIAKHNSSHLMRVYPKGTRISSANLDLVPFWGIGAQICAMNWQSFGANLQINEAMFTGTDGYVLKPASLRLGGDYGAHGATKRLRLHVAGASGIPLPAGRDDDIKPYLTCSLVHPRQPDVKKKTSPYKQHKLSLLHKGDNPAVTDPVWDEVLEWEYPDDELTFLRLLIKSDDAFARNPILVVCTVRLLYVQPGWIFIRTLDLQGHETRCSLLVKFEITDA